MRLPVILHWDSENGPYGASVYDLPGCVGVGDTVEEALDEVIVAIRSHVELLAEDGPVKVSPSDGAQVLTDEISKGGALVFVDAPIEEFLGTARRINITIAEHALSKIDEFVAADSRYPSRSAFLQSAALSAINQQS